MPTAPRPVAGPRRRRPHPARRARLVTGALSAATAVGLTGGLMASHAVASSASAAANSAAVNSTAAATASQLSDDSFSDDSSALAATPAQVANTSSHGS